VSELPFPGAIQVASVETVDRAYARLADQLQACVNTEDCVLLGVMLGGLVPTARLASLLQGNFILDYCHVTRYGDGEIGGEPEWLQPPRADLKGRTILIIDDIFDEGITLQYVVSKCRSMGAERVLSAVLLRKEHQRAAGNIFPDFVGLTVDDVYVFGCGMDYRNRWRHLPAIYAVPADYQASA